jgi:hypothetical protein
MATVRGPARRALSRPGSRVAGRRNVTALSIVRFVISCIHSQRHVCRLAPRPIAACRIPPTNSNSSAPTVASIITAMNSVPRSSRLQRCVPIIVHSLHQPGVLRCAQLLTSPLGPVPHIFEIGRQVSFCRAVLRYAATAALQQRRTFAQFASDGVLPHRLGARHPAIRDRLPAVDDRSPPFHVGSAGMGAGGRR